MSLKELMDNLRCNIHLKRGKIYVFPHIDETTHSHVGLVAIFLLLLVIGAFVIPSGITGLFSKALCQEPVEPKLEETVMTGEVVVISKMSWRTRDETWSRPFYEPVEPFLDVIDLILAPVI